MLSGSAEQHAPSVSAAIMADCPQPVTIPAGVTRENQYRLWGQDRRALVECRQLNAAKGATIGALVGKKP